MGLIPQLDEHFDQAVEIMHNCKGKVIVTGVGKSGHIGAKIAATLSSTGTPSFFINPLDVYHGDLGVMTSDDVVLAISNSGQTDELLRFIPLVLHMKIPIIGMCGNPASLLVKYSTVHLNVHVEKEACPLNLAPTSSTTAQLVMGDALALILMRCRGFSSDDFAKFHPGGALGKQLYLRVKDLYVRNEKPEVGPDDNLTRVIIEMTHKRLGATVVVEDGKLLGIITDGDLRRMLMNTSDIEHVKASQIMTSDPKTIEEDDLVVDALHKMRHNSITQLPVVNGGKYLGIIHLHDVLKEGIF